MRRLNIMKVVRRRRMGTTMKRRGPRRWASVCVEPRLLQRADGLAALRGWSRSRLVREALNGILRETEAPGGGTEEAAAQ